MTRVAATTTSALVQRVFPFPDWFPVHAVVTLLMAPHLDKGILTRAALAALLYRHRTMKPRVAALGCHPDGMRRDVKVQPDLPTSRNVIAPRFDDSLYFANAVHFEQAVLDARA